MKKLLMVLLIVLLLGLSFGDQPPPEETIKDQGTGYEDPYLSVFFDDQKADGYFFGLDENIIVNGRTKCNESSCGAASSFIQWCEGISCNNWQNAGTTGKISLVAGTNPDVNSNLLVGKSYDLNWTIKITEQGIYEIRILADAAYTAPTATYPTARTIYNGYSTKTTLIDNNVFWQDFDANLHLTCIDVNATDCNASYYKIDVNPKKDVNFGDLNLYNESILVSQDGNIGVKYYSVDANNNAEPAKTAFVLIDKTTHSLLTQNFLPNPSNAAKNFIRLFDGNYGLSYCYNSGSNLGDAYFRKSSDALNWNSPVQINSDAGSCSGNYSETGQTPFRTGEGGITLTSNSLNDLIFLFTEWNSTKAWTKILHSSGAWENTTLISDSTGNNPNKDTVNVVTDSNNAIHYILTSKSK
ncbi:MAG: hypothetical protein ABH986_01895 [archaeon]